MEFRGDLIGSAWPKYCEGRKPRTLAKLGIDLRATDASEACETGNLTMMRVSLVVWAAAGLAACNPVQKNAQLVTTSAPGQLLSAGPGDTVMDVKISKSLPNAFGGADVFGRTTDAGRVIVQYVGSQGKTANLIRQNILIETNETTMTRTPLIIPTTQTTTVNGMVGTTPVSGTATTQNLTVIGPRTSQGYSSASPAIPIAVQEGRTVTLEGRTLTVLRVSPNGIEYSLN